jgi:hypothetical protein|uniref:Uncharacterized protein n=1 Tax=virus sp. ctoYX9 TaxID=2825822 RepID=A0A8S5RP62_9VIRU|nr:MAG TPA: hypothetical protein [virus sp. ctoYX9]
MYLCKNKLLNILLNILLLVILPAAGGILLYLYVEYALLTILIIPGFIAFLAGGLNNGSNV